MQAACYPRLGSAARRTILSKVDAALTVSDGYTETLKSAKARYAIIYHLDVSHQTERNLCFWNIRRRLSISLPLPPRHKLENAVASSVVQFPILPRTGAIGTAAWREICGRKKTNAGQAPTVISACATTAYL